MERARSAECRDMTTRLHDAIGFGPHIRTECDIATIPFLIHEAPTQSPERAFLLTLRRAGRIAHGRKVVWRIGDDGRDGICWQSGHDVSTIANVDRHFAPPIPTV